MDDRFTKGFYLGVISGTAANLFDIFVWLLGWNTLRYVDWTGIIIFAHIPPFTLAETIFAFFTQLFLSSVLGVAFAYLLPLINSKNIYLKSWFFSLLIWLILNSITSIFRVEGTLQLPLKTVLSNSLTASLYGLTLARFLYHYEYVNTTSNLITEPAMKPLPSKQEASNTAKKSEE